MWGQKAGPVSAERAERLLARIDLSETALRNILYRAPEPYKERAWRRLQPLNPRAIDLASVLYSAPAKYRARVANRMIAAGVGFETVLHHAPAWIRKKAARSLLARGPTDKELWLIIITVSEPYRSRAWRQLFKNGTTHETRQWLLDRMPKLTKSYQKRACELFVGASSREALKQCLRDDNVPADIKGQIAAWILDHKLPQRDEEFYREILRHAPEPHASEARKRLAALSPDN